MKNLLFFLLIANVAFSQGWKFNTDVVASTTPSSVYATSAQIIFDGNSVVYGIGSTHEISNSDDFTGNNFPAITKQTLVAKYPTISFTTKNFGVNGQTTQQMITDASSQIDALYNGTSYDINILVAREISNDMANNNLSAIDALTNFINYCQDRRKAGFKVLVLTLPPRSIAPGTMSLTEYNTRKETVNNLLRKNWPLFADGIIDVGDYAVSFPDGLHTNDAGYALYGAESAKQASKLIERGFNPVSLSPTVTSVSSTTSPVVTNPSVTSLTLLTLNGTGTNGSTSIVDASPYNRTITNSTVTVSTAQAKFGSSSLFFTGGSYLNLGNLTDWNFGTGDFTLETWFYFTSWSNPTVNPFFARSDGSTVQWTFNVRANGVSIALNVRTADNSGYVSPGPSGSTAAPALNSWHHYALVSQSSGQVRKLYVDGVLYATSTAFPSMETQPTSVPLRIGSLLSTDALNGYGHFNITRTAKYLTNFTPPTTSSW